MPPNLDRRKKVMARSLKLGHCVCNPKNPCPCGSFREYAVCTCAGEKPEGGNRRAPLTTLVHKAGCASKIPQADLLRILGDLPKVSHPDILVGMAAGDDAGVYRLGDGRALVQTVDVFTPCVDDPYLFGRIAAANSLSDIYAMGGRPLTALSIIGFPIEELDDAIMRDILRGGIDTLNEAGCSLIGGHSINDAEIKFGFAVTGLIEERKVVERGAAKDGDTLVLTKPLGTGIICFGAQLGRIGGEALAEVGASMATLNRDAAELMVKYGAHACTDITGFGFLGHMVEMVRNSGLDAEIDLSSVPVFAAVEDCLKNDILPGAVERNQEYAMAWVEVEDPEAERFLPALYDPQTSGGLLVALPEEAAERYTEELRDRGHSTVSIIGKMRKSARSGAEGRVIIRNTHFENLCGTKEGFNMSGKESIHTVGAKNMAKPVMTTSSQGENRSCCDSPPASDAGKPAAGPLDAFQDFMRLANGKGEIDRRAKKLIAIALSVAQRCRPCLVAHIKGALSMGITETEIEEAAALAVAFSGSPSLMLYKEVCKEIFEDTDEHR